ncbi:MAG: methyl-accepting chemotaxis protein [Actinomycetota bacterium]|nr:methyl-accepting chemotaxis protein [Actinomycetota bacterium]
MPAPDTGDREGTPTSHRRFALRARDVIAERGGSTRTDEILATTPWSRPTTPAAARAAERASTHAAPRSERAAARAVRSAPASQLRSKIADAPVGLRVAALVAVLGIVVTACLGAALQGLSSANSGAVDAGATTGALATERAAYQSWLTDASTSSTVAAVSSLPRTARSLRLQNLTIAQARRAYVSARSSLATLRRDAVALALPPAFIRRVARTETDLAGYEHVTSIAAARGDAAGAIDATTLSGLRLSSRTRADFAALASELASRAAVATGSVVSAVHGALLELLVLALVGGALAALATRIAIRSVTGPLAVVGATLTRVLAGDMTARTGIDTADEIGTVARALDAAVAAQGQSSERTARRSADQVAAARDTRAILAILGAVGAATDPSDAVDAAARIARDKCALESVHVAPVDSVSAAFSITALPSGGSLVALPVRTGARTLVSLELVSAEVVAEGSPRADSFAALHENLQLAIDRLVERAEEHAAASELRAKLDAIRAVVDAAAAGDLTVAVPVSDEGPAGRLGESLEAFLSDLRARIRSMDAHSQGLAGATEELSATASKLAAGAKATSAQAGVVSATSEVVASSVVRLAGAAEELGASIREIAASAAVASRVATQAAQVASSTNATVAQLGSSSAEIGEVVKVITAIAQQTNLLALNATIEAARAGDAGNGFAVVASEVKELARETALATEGISAKIEAIQADTGGAVIAIGQISEIIGEINAIQETIASAVGQQTATANEIARSVSGAAEGAAEITQRTLGVATAADAGSAAAAASGHAAGELARMATELQGLVGRFRV